MEINSTLLVASDRARGRAAFRKWFNKQKAINNGWEGYIYAIVIVGTEDIYVGSTKNSLAFRLNQHRAGTSSATNCFDKDKLSIVELQKVSVGEDLKKYEQVWMVLLVPTLNSYNAVKQRKIRRTLVWKGGVVYNGKFYVSKKRLWEEEGGDIPLGTFKSRLHRGKGLEFALKGK